MVISLFLTLALFARCFLSLLSESIAKVERADSRRYRAVGGTPIQHCQITAIIDIGFRSVLWVFQECDSQNALLGRDFFLSKYVVVEVLPG